FPIHQVANYMQVIGLTMDPLIDAKCINSLPNGLICLKGGELDSEIHNYRRSVLVEQLNNWFDEPFFETKKVVYLPIQSK
ncbi:MAG: hypothetical protein ACI4A8_06620, partial [Muribaculaceae bacterium]